MRGCCWRRAIRGPRLPSPGNSSSPAPSIGLSIPGSQPGVPLETPFNYALATIDIVAEILGNTSAGAGNENPAAPEAAGGEFSGFIGGRVRLGASLVLSAGVGYDNNNATLLRVGVAVNF